MNEEMDATRLSVNKLKEDIRTCLKHLTIGGVSPALEPAILHILLEFLKGALPDAARQREAIKKKDEQIDSMAKVIGLTGKKDQAIIVIARATVEDKDCVEVGCYASCDPKSPVAMLVPVAMQAIHTASQIITSPENVTIGTGLRDSEVGRILDEFSKEPH